MNTINELDIAPAQSDALTELGRFFSLVQSAAVGGDSTMLPMFSPFVDAAWHDLLRTPDRYDRFCREHAGGPIWHLGAVGTGPIGWVAAYEADYGPLPQIWFTNVDGTVDEQTWTAYRETGTVVTDWDCRPVRPDDDPEGQPTAPIRPAHATPPQQRHMPDHRSEQ